MTEETVTYERIITAEASAALPDRPLTPAERAHLGLPPEPAPTEQEDR
jgi:hypothetical protein